MNYILAVSIESQVYRTPNIEFRLNNRLLDIMDLKENHSSEIQSIKKQDIYKLWGLDPDKSGIRAEGSPTMVDVLHSEKWMYFEIDEKSLNDKNSFTVTGKDFHTNYNNGFFSKMDKYKILDVLFLPKNFFMNIRTIFEYCTNKNILADFMWSTEQRPLGLGNGWPMYPALRTSGMTTKRLPIQRLSKDMLDEVIFNDNIWINTDREISIIWDDRLELFRLRNLVPNLENDRPYGIDTDHILLSDFQKYCIENHRKETAKFDQIVVPQPNKNLQPKLNVNADTTYLTIHAPAIILLDKFLKNKYIYED